FFSSRRRHTRSKRDWSSDVCSSDLTCDVEFYPALCGTAFKNKGVQLLLNAVVDYLPSPLDVKPIVGHKTDNEEEEYIAKPDDSEPFAALAFKVMTDPFVG